MNQHEYEARECELSDAMEKARMKLWAAENDGSTHRQWQKWLNEFQQAEQAYAEFMNDSAHEEHNAILLSQSEHRKMHEEARKMCY